MKVVISGGIIVTPDHVIQGASITINQNRIEAVGKSVSDADCYIQLSPTDIVFPALINGHDHLFGTYYPRVGTGPYLNWSPWDNDLKGDELYRERNTNSIEDLYLLGSYRNLISGVTTVSDHIPHSVNDPLIEKMPIRVLKDYTLAHECSSYDLQWGRGITTEHNEAVKRNIPFITHIEEGYDEEATLGVEILNTLKALDQHTVLIHGIAFSDSDIDLLAKHHVNVVWCPSSNYYMFKETTNIKRLLQKGVNVCLGTDSPMSGGLNILEEMQFARSLYQKLYGEELDPKVVVQMVTTNPAKAFYLKELGKIEAGFQADILILKDGDPKNPYQSLVNAWFDNIKLVFQNGVPVYGYSEYLDLFKHFKTHNQLIEMNGKERIITGKPIDLYKRIWKNVHFKKVFPFFPVDFYS